ncbi:MAG: hypothetical protein WC777_00435 [Candidatus Gracilibacteria bacterium]|jgi:hypothetical protein
MDPITPNNNGSSTGGTPPPPPPPPTGASAQQAAGQGAAQQGQFTIPQVVQDKYPELIELIKKTESMSNEERDYWFQILPIMTPDQINRLKNILSEEVTQLSKLDDQYQEELAKLNKKHVEEWDVFQKKQERETLKAEEASHEAAEAEAEEDILKKLEEDTGSAGSAGAGATPQV